jgi:hypothetical protein
MFGKFAVRRGEIFFSRTVAEKSSVLIYFFDMFYKAMVYFISHSRGLRFCALA